MPEHDFRRLAGAVRLPVVLVSAAGEVLVANRAARELCEELVRGRPLEGALAAGGEEVGELLRRWTRQGSPVPARLALRGPQGPVSCRVDVARVDLADTVALLMLFRQDQRGQFAHLNDQLERLRHEVRYRRVVEQERASALEAEQAARQRLERLQKLTAALASALSTDDVLEAILSFGPDAVGAEGVVVRLAGDPVVERLSTATPAPVAGLEGDAAGLEPGPLGAASLATSPEFFATRAELQARYPGACSGVAGDRPYLAGVVPLRTGPRATPLGVLGIVCGHAAELAPDGRVTAGIVASLCAQSLERARLHDQERRFTETLQRALLPERLPQARGVEFAVRYMPASESVAVGGDWYDMIVLDGDRLGLVVGDVAGHGPAAATAMAQVRNALRALATQAPTPADALSALNSYLCRQLPDEMATVVFVLLDRAAGVVHYANAGHLPPLHIGGEARPVYLREGLAPPVGVEPGTRYRNGSARVGEGSRIVMYSDGLVERRDESIDLGLRRLARAVSDPRPAGASNAEQLCDRVVGRLVGRGALGDDAVLVVVDLVPRDSRCQAGAHDAGVAANAAREPPVGPGRPRPADGGQGPGASTASRSTPATVSNCR